MPLQSSTQGAGRQQEIAFIMAMGAYSWGK